jgi:hypothetical protein
MNEASQWRMAIARRIAPFYAAYPPVNAIIVGGSTARGQADRYSDIEIGVFWTAPPRDKERQMVVDHIGADLVRLYPYDSQEQVWSDDYTMGRNPADDPQSGVFIEVSHMMSEYVQQTLDRILNVHDTQYDTSLSSHNLIAGVVDCLALTGDELVKKWQARAATYPRELAIAMVNQYGVIDHFWRWRMYLRRGGNLPMLYQSFGYVQERILHVLLALNRVYYFGFKWLDEVGHRLTIKPEHLLPRFKHIYRVKPSAGAKELSKIVDETFALVEQHLPEVDVARLRSIFHYQRPIWKDSPFEGEGD